MANLPAIQRVTCALVDASFISVAANAERTPLDCPLDLRLIFFKRRKKKEERVTCQYWVPLGILFL
jgi:hypothetical protein